ncbi:unnamed protein product [Nezara viridula]|uniref:Uncharacterized protein n=1 Tax=Nezara viridula TaxID=85310 RepID=A0A9P0E3T1_NEZVI|nr:unnamed protein product [Nezara viridula]
MSPFYLDSGIQSPWTVINSSTQHFLRKALNCSDQRLRLSELGCALCHAILSSSDQSQYSSGLRSGIREDQSEA